MYICHTQASQELRIVKRSEQYINPFKEEAEIKVSTSNITTTLPTLLLHVLYIGIKLALSIIARKLVKHHIPTQWHTFWWLQYYQLLAFRIPYPLLQHITNASTTTLIGLTSYS